MLTEQFQAATARRACSCCRCGTGHRFPDAFRRYAVFPTEPLELPAAEIGAQPRPLDRRVDTDRPALSRSAPASPRSPSRRRSSRSSSPFPSPRSSSAASPRAGPLAPGGNGRLVWFTIWQAAASTALTLVAGLPLAWAIGRFRFRGRSLARALVLVPFVLPTVVVATAFLALLPDGYERGLWAILAAHVFFNVAVVTRIVGGAWATIDPRSAEAAAVLGAGPLRRVREVTLPQLAPALSAAVRARRSSSASRRSA